LQQTLETAGKRERRVDVAAANITRAQLERELTERQIATRVKQAYWLALGAQRAVELLAQDTKSFAGIIEYHVIRVREGAMAEADLIRVKLEGQRLELALNSARLDAERFRIHLFREMGRKEFPTIRFAEQLEMLPVLPDATDIPAALDRRPEVRLARQIIAVARSNSRLQQSGAKPNVEVLFGYKRTAGFDTMLGGFQMDLPFHNRNQGNIAAAVAEIRMAESTLAATEALVKAEIEAAARDAQLRQRQAGEAIQTMRTQADEAARIAEAAYREGGADLLRLIDAQRLRTETQLLHARILAEFHQSISALESALGVNP
jgi:cobalt-zinc-cadmium efflux system outer membrane protein